MHDLEQFLTERHQRAIETNSSRWTSYGDENRITAPTARHSGAAEVGCVAHHGMLDEIVIRMMQANSRIRDAIRSNSPGTLASASSQPTTSEIRLAYLVQFAKAKAHARISELQECAADEEIPLNPSSLDDLQEWVDSTPLVEDPNIFLLDNGNFRIIKTGASGSQFGIEFLGSRKIRYTIVERDPVSGKTSARSELIGLGPSAAVLTR